MKLGVYSLSLSDKKPTAVVKLALKYGCQGVEWWCKEGGSHIDTANLESTARKVAGLMRKSGLETIGLAPYFKFGETPEHLKPVFAAARTIGAVNIRSHSFDFNGEVPVAELMRKQRRWLEESVVPTAEQFGVRLVIEQHHYNICCTPNACRQLVDGLPPERVGVIFDPGNSQFEGYTRPAYAISVLGRYLAHVHVKSCRPVRKMTGDSVPQARKYPMFWGTLSKGDLDWELIIAELHKAGYQGYLSLEALDARKSNRKMQEDIPYLESILKKYR